MKYLSIVRYVLLIASALSVILYFTGGVDVDLMLYCAYAFVGIAAVIAIISPLFIFAQNPKAALSSLAGIAVVAVVIIAAYSLSSDMPIPNSAGGFFEDSAVLKISDTGLYATYAALVAAIVSIVGGEIMSLFK